MSLSILNYHTSLSINNQLEFINATTHDASLMFLFKKGKLYQFHS